MATSFRYGHARLATVAGSTRSWASTDALGSVRQTLSDTGTASAPTHYDPWGTPSTGTPSTFGFTGELQDAASGLVHVRARWYLPASGVFASRDPFAGFEQYPTSLHPYLYVGNNPINLRDPSGRCYPPFASLRELEPLNCHNLDQALAIAEHPNAAWYERAAANTYIVAFWGSHGGLGVGLAQLGWAGATGLYAWGAGHVMAGTATGQALLVGGAGTAVAGVSYTVYQAACGDPYAQTALANPQVYGLQAAWNSLGDELYTGWNGYKGLSQPGNTMPGAIGTSAVISREQIQQALSEEVQPFLSRIRAIAGKDVRIGVRGSVVRGLKGPHKLAPDGSRLPFDPNNFDVDIFIVSDELYARTPARQPGKTSRWGSEVPGLPEIQKELDQALRVRPEFRGMRPSSEDPFEFRIWTTQQEATEFSFDDTMYFIGGP